MELESTTLIRIGIGIADVLKGIVLNKKTSIPSCTDRDVFPREVEMVLGRTGLPVSKV